MFKSELGSQTDDLQNEVSNLTKEVEELSKLHDIIKDLQVCLKIFEIASMCHICFYFSIQIRQFSSTDSFITPLLYVHIILINFDTLIF